MNKPISIVIKETKEKIVAACNESSLHITVLDLIMRGLYEEVHSLALKQSSEEEMAYLKSIEDMTKEINSHELENQLNTSNDISLCDESPCDELSK